MSASGTYWRCNITTAENTLEAHGAQAVDGEIDSVHYSSADGDRYFGWEDAPGRTAASLATKFVARFPELCAKGRGSDWLYAGWYAEMLGLVQTGVLPISLADWALPSDALGAIQVVPGVEVTLPLPPGGRGLSFRDGRSSRKPSAASDAAREDVLKAFREGKLGRRGLLTYIAATHGLTRARVSQLAQEVSRLHAVPPGGSDSSDELDRVASAESNGVPRSRSRAARSNRAEPIKATRPRRPPSALQLINTKDAAAILGISVRGLRSLLERGTLDLTRYQWDEYVNGRTKGLLDEREVRSLVGRIPRRKQPS